MDYVQTAFYSVGQSPTTKIKNTVLACLELSTKRAEEMSSLVYADYEKSFEEYILKAEEFSKIRSATLNKE